jgi:hypothetical protein
MYLIIVWSVGLEPTKTASYTHRPVPILGYGPSGSFATFAYDHSYSI